MYIGVQILAGILAALTYGLLEDGKTFPLAPGAKFGWASAGCAEVVFTFLLCFVVLSVATTKTGLSEFFGLAIGSCVTAGGYAIGAVSGGSLNPGVSFGIATSHEAMAGGGMIWHALVYTLFELIGAGIAAGIFMVCHAEEYKKEEEEVVA